MIRLKDILNESMSKNKVQSIIDRVLPQIINDRGLGKKAFLKQNFIMIFMLG